MLVECASSTHSLKSVMRTLFKIWWLPRLCFKPARLLAILLLHFVVMASTCSLLRPRLQQFPWYTVHLTRLCARTPPARTSFMATVECRSTPRRHSASAIVALTQVRMPAGSLSTVKKMYLKLVRKRMYNTGRGDCVAVQCIMVSVKLFLLHGWDEYSWHCDMEKHCIGSCGVLNVSSTKFVHREM